METVADIDTAAREVRLERGDALRYDHLLLASGATHAYFGHDEWAAHAPGLKTLDDALHIRRRILSAFERAEAESDPAAKRALLTFAIRSEERRGGTRWGSTGRSRGSLFH